MNEERLHKLWENTGRLNSKFTIDYDTFKNDMNDIEKRHRFYESVRKLNPKFTVTAEQADIDLGFISEQLSVVGDNSVVESETNANSKKRDGYQTMIDSHTSFAEKHIKEQEEKKAQQAKVQDNYLNAGLSEQDKTDRAEYEKLMSDKAMNQISETFGVELPKVNQYGMPVVEPAKEEADLTTISRPRTVGTGDEVIPFKSSEQKADEKIAAMPSYITRGEDDTDKINANAFERALNTKEGKELYKQIFDNEAFLFKHSNEGMALLEQYRNGEISEEDFERIFREKVGPTIDEEFLGEITSEGGIMRDYFVVAREKLGKDTSKKGANAVDYAIQEYELEKEKEFDNKVREAYKKKYGVYPEDDKSVRYNAANDGLLFRWRRLEDIKSNVREQEQTGYRTSEITGETKKYRKDLPQILQISSAKEFNEDAKEIIDAVENKGLGDFFKAFGRTASDMDTWDLGISALLRNGALLEVVEKADRKEKLTREEQLLMDAALNYMAVSAFYSNSLGRGYKAGTTSAASIPFMIQFVLSAGALSAMEASLTGSAKAAGTKLINALAKHGMQKMTNVAASEATKAIGKASVGMLSSLIGAGALTAAWDIPSIASGSIERQIGDITPVYDEEGDAFVYGGREHKQSPKEATWNAFADKYVERLSEMVLAKTFAPIEAYASGTRMFKNLAKNDVIGAIIDIRNTPFIKGLREKVMFGGLFEEMMEEELGGLLRMATMSDVNTLKEAGLDMDGQIDIFLGLAPTSLLFSVGGTASHYGKLAVRSKKLRDSLVTDAERKLFDNLMSESRSGKFGELAHDFIRNVILADRTKDGRKITNEDKRDALITVLTKYQDVLSEELQKQTKAVKKEENDAAIDNAAQNMRYKETDDIFFVKDENGKKYVIVDGNVGFNQIQGGLVVDSSRSDSHVSVREVLGNGRLGKVEKVRTASITDNVHPMSTKTYTEWNQAKHQAEVDEKETFEYNGIVFDTATSKRLGTKEEYEKKKKEDEAVKNEGKPTIDTEPRKMKNEKFQLVIDGKKQSVTFYNAGLVRNEDGSINKEDSDLFIIEVNGEKVSRRNQEEYIDALSEHLKSEHAKAIEEYNQKQNASDNVEPEAPTTALTDEDRAAAAAEQERMAKEADRQSILSDIQQNKTKQGEIQMDKLTPEETLLVYQNEETPESLMQLLAEQLQYLRSQETDIQGKDLSPIEKKNKTRKIQQSIAAYEAAIEKWLGQEALAVINAPVEVSLVQEETPAASPVQAPVVAEQVETPPPAEPAAPEEETPQDEVPAESDTTPLPPAEPVVENGEVNEEEKEPMNLLDGQYAIVGSNSTRGKEQIVKVTQNEDGTETWTSIDDGKTVSQKAYKKQQFPEQDNMRVLGIKEGNEITPVIVLSGLADLSQAKGELKVVPVNTKDGKVHEAHVSLLYKQDADGGWSLLKGVGSRVLSPAEAAKYNSLDALLDFPIIPNVTVGNFTLRDMLEYPTLAKLKSRLEQLGIEYDKQTINTNLETALARWRELVRENNLNEEFKNNLDKLSPTTLAVYKLYRAGVEPFKVGVPVADTMRTRSNINLYVQLDSIGMLPNNISNPLAQLAVLAEVASDLGIIQKKAKGSYLDAINGILEKTKKEVDANTEEFTKPKEAVEEKDTKDKQPEQPKTETPKQQKPKAEAKEETPAPAKRKTNIDSLRDTFVEAYARTQNQSYNALQKTTAKNAFKGMIDKMSEEDAVALYLNLAMESAKSQGKMQEDMANAAQALLDSKHGAAINAITGGAQQETNQPPIESTEETTGETEQTAEDTVDYEALVAERNELQETIYDMEDDEAAIANARINEINEILRNKAEFMVGSIEESSASQEAKDIIREAVMHLLEKIGIKTHLVTQEEAQRAANAGAELMAKEENLRNGIKALERISKGEEVVYDAMYRSDLEQFGGSPSISFYFGEAGNPNKSYKGGYGISHMASKHGDEMILNALNVIASGRIERVVDGNKTVILTDGTYEVVLSLTRFGEKETWLLSGWKKNETTDGKGEVSTQSLPTQTNPTFSREDLGAAISPAKVNKFIDSTKESTKKNEKSAVEHKNDLSTETLVAGSIVYGYVKGGEIYFTPEGMNPNTPIHEYTHIWANAMQKHNPKAWKSIVEQLKKAEALWNEVVNDPNYENIKNDEDAIASEVLSRYSGKNGAAKLEAEAERVVSELRGMEKGLKLKALISRVKKALNQFWSWVGKDLFKIDSFESVESIADRVLYDMLNNTQLNLDNSKKSSTFAQNNGNYERNDERTMDGEVPSGSRRGESRTDSSNGEGRRLPVRDVPRANGGYDANVAQSVAEQSRLLSEMLTERGIKHTSQQVKLATPQEFYDAIIEAKQLNPHGWMVDAYEAEDYAGFTCLLTEDGKSGIAIKPNGDIISVFSSVKRDNRLQMLMPMAIMQGGRKLDCYYLQGENGNIYGLPKLYSTFGFKIAATTNFVEEYVPQEEYARWKEEHNGSIQGVAAMYISDEVANDLINNYNISAIPNTNSQNFPSADTGYGEALAERDKLMILENARANGTIGTINGKKSNLPDELWAVVRTDAFKDWFGDWQNDPANASKVLDENGEPLVVYHGSKMAGFDEFQQLDESVNGFFTTDNKAGANTYATNREERRNNVMADEAQLNTEPHHGIYSLFANIKNPAVYDFAGKMYNEYGEPLGYYVEMSGEEWDNQPVPKFATEEEALAFARENGEPDSAVKTTYLSTDDLVEMAKAAGHDGVIFKNVLDGAEHNEEQPVMNDYIAFEPNQLKSATQNIGTFNPEDNRIEFMIGPAAPAGSPITDPTLMLDEEALKALEVKSKKYAAKLANPKVQLPEEIGGMFVAKNFDRTEGIRRIMNSIAEYRKAHGMPKMGEGFDVRTMIETKDSKINNKIASFDNKQVKRLEKIVRKWTKVIEKSAMYEKYKNEQMRNQDGEITTLTPIEFLERYLIACDSIEREALTKNPRGIGGFLNRMGINVIQFHNEFVSEFASDTNGNKMREELWEAVRGVTRVTLEVGKESGLISQEEYDKDIKRQFYVPERDFAEVEANKQLWIEGAAWRKRKRGARLRAMQKSKEQGGLSLAANILSNMLDLTYDAIAKAEENKVKVAMFDLLSANEAWCNEKRVPVPVRVWYEKDADGKPVRRTTEPSRSEREEMKKYKGEVRKLENLILNETDKKLIYESKIDELKEELKKSHTPEERLDIETDIRELETLILQINDNIDEWHEDIEVYKSMYPYMDTIDVRNIIFETKEQQKAETVIAYVDGVPCEMHFPNMQIVADALNNVSYNDLYFDDIKKVTSYASAIFTVYNPTFFTVNLARDIPWILSKGYSEYGWQFPVRFAAKLIAETFSSTLWKAVAGKDYSDSIYSEHMKEFYEGGGNTGYTQLPEMQRIKKHVAKWGEKKLITWGDIGNVMSFMNEWSEVLTRSAAYSVVRDMGYNQEEGIRAAKNLSVNFNRKGLGSKFMNLFSSFSMFANAVVQGACGFYRTFNPNEDTQLQRAMHVTRAVMSIGLAPAFAGFISTLLQPDDEDDFLVSDWERDNYFILGNVRIPLSEQLKPFWCIGVNIALGMHGKRNGKDIARSLINSFFINLVPAPNTFNSVLQMISDSIFGYRDFSGAALVDNLLTPQVLKNTNSIANNSNFMGGKFRYDYRDTPEFVMGENDPYIYRCMAELAYNMAGGDKHVNSTSVKVVNEYGEVDYDPMGKAMNVNPKQIEAWASVFVPSGIRDIANAVAVTFGKISGDEDAKFEPKEFNSVTRFYKQQDKELNQYFLLKDIKKEIEYYNYVKSTAKKNIIGAEIAGNEEWLESAETKFESLSNNTLKQIEASLIEQYDKLHMDKIARKYASTGDELKKHLSDKEIIKIDKERDNILRKILILDMERKGNELFTYDDFEKEQKYSEEEKRDILESQIYNEVRKKRPK